MPPCLAYLNTYRKTRELAGAAVQITMPPEMREVLRRVLQKDARPPRA